MNQDITDIILLEPVTAGFTKWIRMQEYATSPVVSYKRFASMPAFQLLYCSGKNENSPEILQKIHRATSQFLLDLSGSAWTDESLDGRQFDNFRKSRILGDLPVKPFINCLNFQPPRFVCGPVGTLVGIRPWT
ncbi:MAG TPA: hypothetical protein VFW05_01840 [Verrucomicrobiae bacterium]|nr:hypothetical protein [Verrucomicrobiae bacterium]